MQRYFINLSFNGTHFHGWQVQENAVTVQQELEHCLSLLFRDSIKLVGCGRTDSGVHARKYVAHFDVKKMISSEELQKLFQKINIFLPNTIVVHQIIPVHENLHARFDAHKRTYKYFITRKKNPFLKEFSFEYTAPLNLRMMQLACNVLKKYEDFTSFSKTGGNSRTNICKVFDAQWEEFSDTNLLVFTITADRFLRNMVRAIVGTMIDVGREKISLCDFRSIIEAKKRSLAGVSIEANGLFLWDVEYPSVKLTQPPIYIFPIQMSVQ